MLISREDPYVSPIATSFCKNVIMHSCQFEHKKNTVLEGVFLLQGFTTAVTMTALYIGVDCVMFVNILILLFT